jgi:malic enzyme
LAAVIAISPSFGGVNLEDIAAPVEAAVVAAAARAGGACRTG